MAEDFQPTNWWNTPSNDDNHSNYTFSTSSTDWSRSLLSNSTEAAESSFNEMIHEGLSTEPFYEQGLPNSSSSSKLLQQLFFHDHQRMAYSSVSTEVDQLSVNQNSNKFKGAASKQKAEMNQVLFGNNAIVCSGDYNFYPSLIPPIRPQLIQPKPSPNSLYIKSSRGARETSSRELALKKPRIETPATTLPVKERIGDRISALQQLVSPFGKTDRASVLHEAIEYIKFLHDQVSALSTPYLKTDVSRQQQEESRKSKEEEGFRRDLSSRGLCLVPIASTYPVINLWSPNFGRTYL